MRAVGNSTSETERRAKVPHASAVSAGAPVFSQRARGRLLVSARSEKHASSRS